MLSLSGFSQNQNTTRYDTAAGYTTSYDMYQSNIIHCWLLLICGTPDTWHALFAYCCSRLRQFIMIKQSYEMIEGQVGGALPGGGAAVVEGEMGSLLPGARPARKGLLAACMGTVVAIALLVGCVAATSPNVSARDASSGAAV